MTQFDPEDFAQVSHALQCEYQELEPGFWREMEPGRFRSAASRAYYAVFLQLKFRIQKARLWTQFPRTRVHTKLKGVLSDKLEDSHPLPGYFRKLLIARTTADYDAAAKAFTASEVDDLVDASFNAMEEIDKLTDEQTKAIADELFDRSPGDR